MIYFFRGFVNDLHSIRAKECPPLIPPRKNGRISFASEFALPQRARIAALAPRLVNRHRDRICKIEGTDLTRHRQPHAFAVMLFQKRFRKPLRLLAEHKKIPFPVRDVAVRVFCFCRKKPKTPVGKTGKDILDAVIIRNVDKMPVIQSRPFQIFVRNLESERADEMQSASRRRASAHDIAGVLRDLRLYQNDIEHALIPPGPARRRGPSIVVKFAYVIEKSALCQKKTADLVLSIL